MKYNGLEFSESEVPSHHGDVQLFPLTKLPSGVSKVDKRFIAASERSGHCHVLCGDYEMFEKPGTDGVFVLVGTDGCTLNHAKLQTLTPQVMSKNQITEVADHKPNFYEAGTVLFVGIQKRKKHFSKVWQKVED